MTIVQQLVDEESANSARFKGALSYNRLPVQVKLICTENVVAGWTMEQIVTLTESFELCL